eukprot:12247-Heterococcus_DN1.PRE.3
MACSSPRILRCTVGSSCTSDKPCTQRTKPIRKAKVTTHSQSVCWGRSGTCEINVTKSYLATHTIGEHAHNAVYCSVYVQLRRLAVCTSTLERLKVQQ